MLVAVAATLAMWPPHPRIAFSRLRSVSSSGVCSKSCHETMTFVVFGRSPPPVPSTHGHFAGATSD